jgi:hypothetical protein
VAAARAAGRASGGLLPALALESQFNRTLIPRRLRARLPRALDSEFPRRMCARPLLRLSRLLVRVASCQCPAAGMPSWLPVAGPGRRIPPAKEKSLPQ